METIIICVLAGMGAGLGTGFAGMSAATIISPMLITFLGVNAFEAIGIALASDVLASAVSAFTYGKNKNIDLKRGVSLFVSVLIFTGIGAYVSHLFPSTTIGNLSVFGSLFMGLNFLKKSFSKEKPKKLIEFNDKMKIIMPIFCGALIGLICGFIGAGGGMMMLLLLTMVLGYELKTAVGTSVFIMTFTALFGSYSHFSLDNIMPDPLICIICVISTLAFASIGSRYANKANPRKLNRATGLVLASLGGFMIFAQYFPALQY
ncbi:MAG: sulfite exporter TauE/SafE family protein [Clostridia bacterium]